ncbi:hypothetical protein [Mycobacteroides abscessus]|uniref:hypothetical protein n=1 Tax=Mycobacteroides abscessus TaxID=36809 RepID=UPI0005E77135|nr:hypothetical protein [Mycobacteroides abscessus]CPR69753.1 Uncharacterised protein [Mycobacteroides abscessus]CPU70542.1 Uncharacterised protein [Mycobacteroides abscessus]
MPDWGTVPAWFGAVCTSGGVAWGAWTFRLSRHDKLREHADRMVFRVEQVEPARGEDGMRYLATVENLSDVPMFNVEIFIRAWGDFSDETVDKVGPGEEAQHLSKVMHVRPRRPGAEWWRHPSREDHTLTFTDIAGYRWQRTPRGGVWPAPQRKWGAVIEGGGDGARWERGLFWTYKFVLPRRVRHTAEEMWVWRPWRKPSRRFR